MPIIIEMQFNDGLPFIRLIIMDSWLKQPSETFEGHVEF